MSEPHRTRGILTLRRRNRGRTQNLALLPQLPDLPAQPAQLITLAASQPVAAPTGIQPGAPTGGPRSRSGPAPGRPDRLSCRSSGSTRRPRPWTPAGRTGVGVASDSHLEGQALILGVHQTGSTPDPQLQVPSRGGQHPRAMPIALGEAGLGALVWCGADHAGELGFDEGLVDGLGGLADAVIDLRDLECVQDLQSRATVRCVLSREPLAVVSLTIARWPFEVTNYLIAALLPTPLDGTPLIECLGRGQVNRVLPSATTSRSTRARTLAAEWHGGRGVGCCQAIWLLGGWCGSAVEWRGLSRRGRDRDRAAGGPWLWCFWSWPRWSLAGGRPTRP